MPTAEAVAALAAAVVVDKGDEGDENAVAGALACNNSKIDVPKRNFILSFNKIIRSSYS